MHMKGDGGREREKRKDKMRYRRHKGMGGGRRGKDEARWKGREDRVEGKRRKDKAVKQRRGSGREGRRAEDTAAMKPVICQISHGRAHIHIMSLNRKRTMSNHAGGQLRWRDESKCNRKTQVTLTLTLACSTITVLSRSLSLFNHTVIV